MGQAFIIDTTLRDGEQTAGVAFTQGQKIKIAKALDLLGVDVIEVGIPAMGIEEIRAIEKINTLGLHAELLTWNRMKIKDVKLACKTEVKNHHISVPASDIHIYKKLKMTREKVLEEMKRTVSYALDRNCSVSIGAEDASRADCDFLISLYQEASNLGVKRVRFADTVGKLDPFKSKAMIEKILGSVPIDIDFHGHNDLGMGTANALGAYQGGAKYISCSINGLGERAGNTALEEIVVALEYIEKCKTNIRLDQTMKISKLVEMYSGKKIPDGKPIVGESVFTHESGIHVDGLLKDANIYEEISPDTVGRRRKIVLGKFSGTASIQYYYKDKGIELSRGEAASLLTNLRKEYIKKDQMIE